MSSAAAPADPISSVTGVLSGWGRFPRVPGTEWSSERLDHASRGVPLTRGLGRAYAALPARGDTRVAGSCRANRLLAFDECTGVLTAEAGLTLDELIRVFLPRGFFSPVSPGTRFVTLGGMVAADVHGKNHHDAGTMVSAENRRTISVKPGFVKTSMRSWSRRPLPARRSRCPKT